MWKQLITNRIGTSTLLLAQRVERRDGNFDSPSWQIYLQLAPIRADPIEIIVAGRAIGVGIAPYGQGYAPKEILACGPTELTYLLTRIIKITTCCGIKFGLNCFNLTKAHK
jgi:hypothetical protein